MKKLLMFVIFILSYGMPMYAQLGVNTDNSAPDASAGLDVKFTNRGFLPPRMTTAQRDAILFPAEGLTIYNTDLKCIEFYGGNSNGWFCPCLSYGTISCAGAVINGVYFTGISLTSANTVTITVVNTTTGGYNISTNTVNGFHFSKMGTFTTIGSQSVVLNGAGTPAASGSITFTVTYGTASCTFSVTVIDPINIPCPGTPTVSYGSVVYNTVQVGTQCWLKENLNIGTMIPGSSEQTNHSAIEKYCYYNLASYCTQYGGLYQWDNVMQWTTTPGTQGICPSGWHIPSDGDWNILMTYLGGTLVAGGKMKTTGTVQGGNGLWFAPNAGATNISGFSAIPGGYRNTDGTFNIMGSNGAWWSSTEISITTSWSWSISSDFSYFGGDNVSKVHGESVRCLKN